MAWRHRGFEIELLGASFCTDVGSKHISLSSLNAVKKAIDKHLDAKAQEVTLNLPVVVRIAKERSYRQESGEPDRVVRGVITGMDQESRAATGLDIPDGWTQHTVLPDTPDNVKRLRVLIQAEAAHEKAEEAIEGREVGMFFHGHGRIKRPYSESVQLLVESYKKAQKAESTD